MYIDSHSQQEHQVTNDKSWVVEPAQVVSVVFNEVSSLDIAINRSESNGKEKCNHWTGFTTFNTQGKQKRPTNGSKNRKYYKRMYPRIPAEKIYNNNNNNNNIYIYIP